jgi:hypothetical protein
MSESREDLTQYVKTSPVLEWLHKQGLPLTRKSYIAAATMGLEDYAWTEDDEAGMPEPLQDYDALARERAERDEPDDTED